MNNTRVQQHLIFTMEYIQMKPKPHFLFHCQVDNPQSVFSRLYHVSRLATVYR
jgi:hypothetical protein